jgi:hypothetical protein
MSRIPDSVLLQANAITSALLLAALGLVLLALVGGPRVSWVFLVALVLPLTVVSSEVTRRAGGKAGVVAWHQSQAWSADAFDLLERDTAGGRRKLESGVAAAGKAGYGPAGGPTTDKGRFGPIVRQRMVRIVPR